MAVKALMLAAGVGRRLYGDDYAQPPKALLEFDGKSLLRRHIELLVAEGVDELVLVVGHRKDEVLAEAHAAAPDGFVKSLFNPRYRGGPILSLWTAGDLLKGGDDILFMDADVLYHPLVLQRLLRSPHDNCFLLDRNIEPGEEPVKLCIRDGVPVDFGKRVKGEFDLVGEWPGFMRMGPEMAAKVMAAADTFIDEGRLEVTYEEAMGAVVRAEPPGAFGYEDISGIPWIEIDFPADLLRAEKIVLPRLGETFEEVPDASDRQAAASKTAT